MVGKGVWVERIRQFVRANQAFLIVGSIVATMVVLYFAPGIFVTVREGQAAVLFRRFFGGTVRDRVYGEGLHVVMPWDKMTIYNVRVQECRRAVQVLDNTGLQYLINISIRYHPEYNVLAVLHQKVGPDYLDKIVVPEVEGVLRSTASGFDVKQLYTSQYEVLAKIVNDSLEHAGQSYVVIDNVVVRSIELPEKIKNAIVSKREEEQLAEAYTFRLTREEDEAKRRIIEAKGFKEANDIISQSLNTNILKWKGIEATMALSGSTNSKMVFIGSGPGGLPIILGADK